MFVIDVVIGFSVYKMRVVDSDDNFVFNFFLVEFIFVIILDGVLVDRSNYDIIVSVFCVFIFGNS